MLDMAHLMQDGAFQPVRALGYSQPFTNCLKTSTGSKLWSSIHKNAKISLSTLQIIGMCGSVVFCGRSSVVSLAILGTSNTE